MEIKIRKHQQSRMTFNWETSEVYFDLAEEIHNLNSKTFDIVLVDCLTMWLTNHYLKGSDINRESIKLLESVKKAQTNLILVSNEIGYGVVPENKMAREFRDLQGKLNQKIAFVAKTVIQVVAGLPVVLKGEPPETDYDN
jgi:adenosylcobinamide kinase/adenosylcobinamide-phosphate guanylyltransferase